jgi:hypothetical protein
MRMQNKQGWLGPGQTRDQSIQNKTSVKHF